MTRTYFEIGRTGGPACASCLDVRLLADAGNQLAPGVYWIDEVRAAIWRGWPPAPVEETLDWGTLVVTGDGHAIVRRFTPRGVEVV